MWEATGLDVVILQVLDFMLGSALWVPLLYIKADLKKKEKLTLNRHGKKACYKSRVMINLIFGTEIPFKSVLFNIFLV